ncbi:MAG: hypothetical protein EOO10_15885 [Chitinophagaceae bacterium]|nr:MAG: hypothetical protein EOO10_15885 [Chitinophagaceae bacterium]
MSKTLTDILTLISGTCWTVVYLLIIIRSYRDKTYGMPYWALAFNFSWEFIFSFLLSTDLPDLQLQLLVNRVWLFFDLLIFIAYFRYGRKEWPAYLPRSFFYPYSILVLLIGFFFVYLISVELDHSLGVYAAFIQNLMMSWLFIAMLNNRKTAAGQSVAIAAFKLVGTLAPTIIYGAKSAFVLYLGAGCFVADLIYLLLLVRLRRQHISIEKKSYPKG